MAKANRLAVAIYKVNVADQITTSAESFADIHLLNVHVKQISQNDDIVVIAE